MSAPTATRPPGARTIDEVLSRARAGLTRLDPHDAAAVVAGGGVMVDIRPAAQRAAEGEPVGALVIERNVLEWRLDPASASRLPEATGHDINVILFCNEGYSSSLAAASLHDVGLYNATDLVGGFQAWRDAGLPVRAAE